MNRLGWTVISFVLVMLFSCAPDKKPEQSSEVNSAGSDTTGIIQVDVFEDYGINFDLLIDTLTAVPLETTSESVIGAIDKLLVSGEYIVIMDRRYAKAVLVFDDQGKFRYKIYQIGDGPGEFKYMEDIDVDERYVYILDNGRKINQYEISTGKYVKEFSHGYRLGGDFITSRNDNAIYIDKRFGETDISSAVPHCQIYKMDFHAENLECQISYGPEYDIINNHPMMTFSRNHEDIFMMPAYTYDLYEKKIGEEFTCKYRLDFGVYNWDLDHVLELSNVDSRQVSEYFFNNSIVSHLGRLHFTDRYLTMVIGLHRNDYNLIIDRRSHKVVLSGLGTSSSPNYGISIYMPIAAYDDAFYSSVEIAQFIENDDYDFVKEVIESTSYNLSTDLENRNPILLKYTFKDDNTEVYKHYKLMKGSR